MGEIATVCYYYYYNSSLENMSFGIFGGQGALKFQVLEGRFAPHSSCSSFHVLFHIEELQTV